MKYKKIKHCRICKSKKLITVLDLGLQSYTGKFPKSDKINISKTPLAISLCLVCKFVQLSHDFNNISYTMIKNKINLYYR